MMLGRWMLPVLLIAGWLMGGCSTAIHADSAHDAPVVDPGFGLDWPPPDTSTRMASDDMVAINGADFDYKGGDARQSGKDLLLSDSIKLSYAVYSMAGFSLNLRLTRVSVDFTLTPVEPGDTAIYLGLSNHAKGYWEWYQIQPPDGGRDVTAFADYASASGITHVALVLQGPGTARINRIRFDRTGSGAYAPTPINFAGTAVPGSIELSWDPVELAQGYNVYRSDTPDIGAAVKINPQPISAADYSDSTVAILTQYYYWVTSIRGPESAPSLMLPVTSIDTAPDVPQNLTAVATVGRVDLAWDSSPGTQLYRVYRAEAPDFSGTVSQFSAPSNFYADAGMPRERMYYYHVTAYGLTESGPSNQVSVFAPSSDLPAPQNLRVVPDQSNGDWVTFAWDWTDPDPGTGFRLYIDSNADFALNSVFRTVNLGPAERQTTQFSLPSGATYYVRICAVDGSGLLGAMTDALPFTVEQYWTWTAAEDVGQGDGEIDAVVVGDTVTATYFGPDSSTIMVSQRDSDGAWAEQSSGLDPALVGGGFSEWVGIASGAGEYLVGGYAIDTGDMWVSSGVPGDAWTPYLLHGDNQNYQGRPASGLNFQVAASDTEFAVCHFYNDTGELLLHTRPIAGTDADWTQSTLRSGVSFPVTHDLAYQGEDLYSLMRNGDTLELGDRDGAFAWGQIATGQPPFGAYCGLVPYDGGWTTPAYLSTSKVLNYVHNDGTAWLNEPAVQGYGDLESVSMCPLAAPGSGLMVVYKSVDTTEHWYYSVFDGAAWDNASLIVFPAQPQAHAKLLLADGLPCLLYDDFFGHIRFVRGIPPGS